MSVKSLSIMSVKYPKIKFDNKQRVFVVFYHNNKRYRLSNGSKVNIDIYPNSYPIGKREEIANLLAARSSQVLEYCLEEQPAKAPGECCQLHYPKCKQEIVIPLFKNVAKNCTSMFLRYKSL